MLGVYVMLGGMALFAGIITALDLWAGHQRRKAQRH